LPLCLSKAFNYLKLRLFSTKTVGAYTLLFGHGFLNQRGKACPGVWSLLGWLCQSGDVGHGAWRETLAIWLVARYAVTAFSILLAAKIFLPIPARTALFAQTCEEGA
jgi:hypothetical protein